MRFLRPVTATLFAASLVALSSCGGSSSSTRWDANAYTATAGDIKVFLANDDSVKHILVIRQGDKVVGDLELTVTKKGTVDEGTINLEAGEYSVYCIIPGHGNMNSTLTVS
jgi:plastocyanin